MPKVSFLSEGERKKSILVSELDDENNGEGYSDDFEGEDEEFSGTEEVGDPEYYIDDDGEFVEVESEEEEDFEDFDEEEDYDEKFGEEDYDDETEEEDYDNDYYDDFDYYDNDDE